MKKFLFLSIFFTLIIFLGIYIFKTNLIFPNIVPFSTMAPVEDTSRVEGLAVGNNQNIEVADQIVIESPKTLIIPKIGVKARVEYVGLDREGKMDIPKVDGNVAWYNLGYKVGENGSSVMAGHLDTRTGAPAVFYNLSNLQVGDIVTVEGDNDERLDFKVVRKAVYKTEDFPLNEVFDTKGVRGLNLITCEGVYNSAARSYSQRVVVYTQIVD